MHALNGSRFFPTWMKKNFASFSVKEEPHGLPRLSWQAVYILAGVGWSPAILVGVLSSPMYSPKSTGIRASFLDRNSCSCRRRRNSARVESLDGSDSIKRLGSLAYGNML